MRVTCPSCGEMVPGADMDLRKGIAVCKGCGEVTPLPTISKDGEGNAIWVAKEISGMPLHAYRPAGLALTEVREPQRFRFDIRPNRAIAVGVLVFAIVWNTFLLSWLSFVADERSSFGVLRYWFPLFHLVAGIALLHTAACLLVNHAELDLNTLRFSFRHRPLWQPNAFSEPLRTLRCFIDQERISRGRKDRWFRQTVSWTIGVLTRDGRSHSMDLYLADRNEARYLALRLNRALDEMRAREMSRSAPADTALAPLERNARLPPEPGPGPGPEDGATSPATESDAG